MDVPPLKLLVRVRRGNQQRTRAVTRHLTATNRSCMYTSFLFGNEDMAGSKRPRSNPPPAIFPGRRRLDSWKEIASYLNRSEKTVRRWEENEGLPVHRLLHEKRSSVYAYTDELETWWKSRKSQDATDVDSSDDESPGLEDESVFAGETFPPPSVDFHFFGSYRESG